MRLLTQGLAAEFGAPAILEYRPGGVVCNISGPTLEPDPRRPSSQPPPGALKIHHT